MQSLEEERNILIQTKHKRLQGSLRIQETCALDLSVAVARKCIYYRVRTTSLSPRIFDTSTTFQSWTRIQSEDGMHKYYRKTRTYCIKKDKVLCMFLLYTTCFEHPSIKKEEEPDCLAPFLLEAPNDPQTKGGIQ